MAKVVDPQQNNHKCWGILEDEKGVKSYFVKLSSDAHFVSYGTHVETTDTIFNSASDARNALINKLRDNNSTYIPSDDFPEGTYFEIKSIDIGKTSELTQELNKKTEELFTEDGWLANHPDIGVDAIKAGRQLPPLPKKG